MADKTIPELDAAATLDGTEEIPAAQGSNDVRITLNQIIADLIQELLDDKYDASNPNNYIALSAVTAAVVTGKALTGLSVSGSAVVSTDTILEAIGKLQNQVNAVAGGVNYQGTWNANTNSPTITGGSGTKGHYRVVTTTGTTNIDGINDWKLGDWIIYNGTAWQKVDNTDALISVNGYTGIVTLTIADIPSLQAALDAKADIVKAARTGTAIAFDKEATYGSYASPETGNITVNATGAVDEICQKLYHQNASEPTYPASFVKIVGVYDPSKVNIYLIVRINSSLYHYLIYQE